jgi:subtilisin family serine protease
MWYNKNNMFKLYFKLRKKSIVVLLAAAFFCSAFLANYARAKTPSDPKFNFQAQYYNQIGAPLAWEHTTGSSNVVVAVIDTGVDIFNNDLVNNIWQNLREIGGNGIDDDNNGFVDDTRGWNFVEDNNSVNIPNILPSDDSGAVNHGTVLAGIIGEEGNNSLNGSGLNWHVKIMPLRAISSDGGGSLENVAKAVNYAANNGADIISLSFVGFTTDPLLTEALHNAYKKGVLVVVAAGNSRNDTTGNENLTKVKQYPICLDDKSQENWILGVASVGVDDTLSDFGDYGSCIDLSAPGEAIFSTQKYSPQDGYGKDFGGAWYGTSFSAPMVAGAAALIKSVKPDWSAKEITDVLLRTADDVDAVNPGFAGQMGYGRLNIGKAVQKALELNDAPSLRATVFAAKVIRKPKNYAAQILANGKVIRTINLVDYLPKSSKWFVNDEFFVHARLGKNRIIVDVWDLSGVKKLSNLILPGFTSISSVSISRVWGSDPNPIIIGKKGKISQKIIIDVSSASWKVE